MPLSPEVDIFHHMLSDRSQPHAADRLKNIKVQAFGQNLGKRICEEIVAEIRSYKEIS